MWTITVWGRTTNPTLDYLSLGLWSIIEIDVGVICACMPGMSTLLRRTLPRLFGTINGSSKGTGKSSGLRTYNTDRSLGSSPLKNKISKTTDIHQSFGSLSERDSKDDDYELLERKHSQTLLRPAPVTLNLADKTVYPIEHREYRKKW